MYKEYCKIDHSLRLYQQRAKEQIFSAWDECDNVMFQMPTGTGKTRLFSSIIRDIKNWGVLNSTEVRILIIAHRVELIDQISDNLERYKVSHGIIAGGKQRDLRPSVQVASVQTITHKSNQDLAEGLNVDFIIIDEAHHSVANSYKKLWQFYPYAKKLGVTATPWRMNHRGFQDIFDTLILSEPIIKFIEQGWLAPYNYYSINNNSSIQRDINSITEFDIEGDYKISALENCMDTFSVRAQLLNSYLKFAKGKKGIIYSISRKHSDHICEEFRNAGINIVRIDSLTPKDERKIYVDRFKQGLIDVIVNVDIFSEGFDCPDIEFIQLARPTKSLVKYLQQVGRGLRPTKEKSRCIILDNVGLHFTFGLPNAERDWSNSFIGDLTNVRHKSTSSVLLPVEDIEGEFEEGDDEMLLIEGVENTSITEPKVVWKEEDDALLRTLCERKCPIEVIASVFEKDASTIQERINALDIKFEIIQ